MLVAPSFFKCVFFTVFITVSNAFITSDILSSAIPSKMCSSFKHDHNKCLLPTESRSE